MTFVSFALVDVLTGSVVSSESVSRLARTLVRAPNVVARLLAQVRSLGTLVHVYAVLVVVRFSESFFAVADVGPLRVDAFGHARTHLAPEAAALVDI